MASISIRRTVLIAGVLCLLLIAGYSGLQIHRLSDRQKEIKADYSIINNVSFGLLSVSRWRDLLVGSVSKQIENFQLTPDEKAALEKEIEGLLNALIDKADSIMNRPQRSVGGKLRKLAFHTFVKPEDLKKETPEFAHKIMAEVMRPQSRERLTYVAKKKLEDLGQETYDSANNRQLVVFDSLFHKYQVNSSEAFDQQTEKELASIKQRMFTLVAVMVGTLLALFAVWWLIRKQKTLHPTLYVLSILMAFIFLATGLTSVMIEIDARIDSLNFNLIGEAISFKNQVLFFQSKSIADVVVLLIRNGKYDSILVGLLILCFSILFPVSKLICTGLYVIGKKDWTRNRLVTYFAFYSGKWSMADVMVVAIFMAYIGFNGILNNQMADLNFRTSAFTSIATNHTSLQPGYAVFVAFVLFSLVLSQILLSDHPKH